MKPNPFALLNHLTLPFIRDILRPSVHSLGGAALRAYHFQDPDLTQTINFDIEADSAKPDGHSEGTATSGEHGKGVRVIVAMSLSVVKRVNRTASVMQRFQKQRHR